VFQYCIFYKPYEVLSQFSAEGNKKTLAHFLSQLPKDVYPVGRLDYDSEGLLLLTNDKSLTHRLLEPRFAHRRTYWVQVEGSITEEALQQLRSGVDIRINGNLHRTLPAKAALLADPDVPERNPPIRFRASIPTSWVALSLSEGKNRPDDRRRRLSYTPPHPPQHRRGQQQRSAARRLAPAAAGRASGIAEETVSESRGEPAAPQDCAIPVWWR
jgi:23S rRNA pseudouridine2457 synthase